MGKKREVTAKSLGELVTALELIHLHIIWCSCVKYEDIAEAIRNSRSLQSVTFVEDDENHVINDERLSLLANARESSGVEEPLRFLQEAAFDAQLSQQKNFELKKLDSARNYILY